MSERERRARLLRQAIGRRGPIEPTEGDWNEWIRLAEHERMIPQLFAVVTEDGGLESRLDAATLMQVDVMRTMVRFEHDLLVIADVLSRSTSSFAVLKGVATAHLDHPDPARRQFGDVDLLVDPTEMSTAIAALNQTGWVQAYPLPRHHERFTHAITLRNHDRVEVDLHQRIAHRSVGLLVPTSELLAELDTFVVADRKLPALSPIDRLIHAALHESMSTGNYRRLSSTADVLVLAEARRDQADAVIERADAWRVGTLVRSAIAAVYAAASLHLPPEWASATERPNRNRDRLVDHAYSGKGRRPLTEELAHLRRIPTIRNRYDYLTGYFRTDGFYAQRNQRKGPLQQSRYLWSRIWSGRR